MLTFPINTTSVQESNIFLRKLWSELNQIKPLGWQMYPYKHDNTVTIGTSTFGEISYDYTRKGCIKNLYIDNQQDETISKAVQNAKSNGMKSYVISLELKNSKDIYISDVSFERIKIFTYADKVYLQCTFEAYSDWDVKVFFPNKFASILSIIYEYTYVLFNIEKVQLCEGNLVIENSEFQEYDNSWIDFDECPQSECNALILPCECLRLLSYVIDDKSYDENIELLLNSSNLLTTTQRLLQEIEYPYSSYNADIINSMVCSSLEPLSQILDKSTERCSECGNMIFSITKKIKKMCTRYFDENFSKYICDVIYKTRSTFLHTGQPESTQRSSSRFCPQISASSGSIMMPHGMVRDVVFDYSSFLFRNIAHDYFAGKI